MKLIWLSFAGEEGSRGASVVAVSDNEIALMKIELSITHPQALPGAEVIAAATRKAHELGCNPGGQILSIELDPNKFPVALVGTLRSKEEWMKESIL